jgi:hypothetical protein
VTDEESKRDRGTYTANNKAGRKREEVVVIVVLIRLDTS